MGLESTMRQRRVAKREKEKRAMNACPLILVRVALLGSAVTFMTAEICF
jgi:hypothetical protein